MGHDVFISYSSKDKAVGDAVCQALEGEGVRCWIAPRDILPGADWGEAIVDAISASRLMVMVFSSSANQSHQIKREVERAVHHGIPIIPLRIEEEAPSKSLEYFISTPHWLDALTPPMEAHLVRLAQTAKALLGETVRPRDLPKGERPAVTPPPARQFGPEVRPTTPPPRQGRRRAMPGRVTVTAVTITILAVAAVAWGWWEYAHRAPAVPGGGHARLSARPDVQSLAPPLAVPLRVEVWRNDRWLNVIDATPLADGERVRVRADVPPGYAAKLFLFDAEGNLTGLAELAADHRQQTLEYPGPGQAVPLTGKPGTEVVLVCARRSDPLTLEELRGAWGEEGAWPPLPAKSVLQVTSKGVESLSTGRGFGPPEELSDAQSVVSRRLEMLQQALDDKVEALTAIAFPHVRPPGNR